MKIYEEISTARLMFYAVLVSTIIISYAELYRDIRSVYETVCGQKVVGCVNIYIGRSTFPAEVIPFVAAYRKDRRKYRKSSEFARPIKASFGPTARPEVAYCVNMDYQGLIVIDPIWWAQNTSYHERLELVYHELGHCDLGYDHTPRTMMSENLRGNLNNDNLASEVKRFFNAKIMGGKNESIE